MSIAITIAGTDRTTRVEKDSIVIQNILTRKRDKCNFSILHNPTYAFTPTVGQEVIITLDGTRVFAGVIVGLEQETTSYKLVRWKVECEDYTRLLDRKLVTGAFENQTIDQIMTSLASSYFPTGFTTGGVNAPVTVKYVNFSYKPLSKCIELLADYAGYDWYVDYNKVLYFFKQSSVNAPVDIEDDNGSHIYESLRIRRDNSQVRNSIVVRGGEYLGNTYTAEIDCNGVDFVFPLPYKFSDFQATLTGQSLNLGVDPIDNPDLFDALYNFQEKIIKFRESRKPSVGSLLKAFGRPYLPVIIKLQDTNSIATFSADEGGDGVYEYLILDKTIKTKEGARQRARAELNTYATTLSEGEFQTHMTGFRAGQRVLINSTTRSLNEQFIVNKVTLKQFDTDSFFYEISLITTKTFDLIDLLVKLSLDKNNEIEINPDEVVNVFYVFQDNPSFTDVLGTFTVPDITSIWGDPDSVYGTSPYIT